MSSIMSGKVDANVNIYIASHLSRSILTPLQQLHFCPGQLLSIDFSQNISLFQIMVAISSTRIWYILSCHLHNWRLRWRVAWIRHLHHLEPLFTDWHLHWWSLMHCRERKKIQSHIDNLVFVILCRMAPSTKRKPFFWAGCHRYCLCWE